MTLFQLLQSTKSTEALLSSSQSQNSEFDSSPCHVTTNRNQSLFHVFEMDILPGLVHLDHCYARPWNSHPESNHARPAKMLFMRGILFNPVLDGPSRADDEIDVETVQSRLIPPYDITKACTAMRECERFVLLSNGCHSNDDKVDNWEDDIPRAGWTVAKKRLFSKIVKILQADRLARLVHVNNSNEPVMRRLTTDKTVSRMRHLYSSVQWDTQLMQWLHQLLMDKLPTIHLNAYVDALQTLKSKVPTLLDKMLLGSKPIEGFAQLLKRPWDPVSSILNQHKMKKVAGSPLIVWTPGDPAYSCVGQSRRMKFWHSQLSNIGKLITVNPQVNPGVSVGESLEAIVTAVRYEVMELKLNFPNRPIVLIGWTIGALIACEVALVERVHAVVCLGFPLTGVNGSRGDLDDPLLETRTPTLFVAGQSANMCSVDDIEDFRERMKADSGLVVIGGGDDHLRVSGIKKKLEGITQVMVDRCIIEEIAEFLSHVTTNKNTSSVNEAEFLAVARKRSKSKDSNSTKKLKLSCLMLSRNDSPTSSTTETSSSGSSSVDPLLQRPTVSAATPEMAIAKQRGRPPTLQRSFTHHSEEASSPPTPTDQHALRMIDTRGGASFFSQQLGFSAALKPEPVYSSTLAATLASPVVTSPNKEPYHHHQHNVPQPGPISIQGFSTFSAHFQQRSNNIQASRPSLAPSRPFYDGHSPLTSFVQKIAPLPPPPTTPNFLNVMGVSPKTLTNQKSVSYLTLANPMLSNILDGNATPTSLLGKHGSPSPSFINSANQELRKQHVQQIQQTMIEPMGPGGLKTYMRHSKPIQPIRPALVNPIHFSPAPLPKSHAPSMIGHAPSMTSDRVLHANMKQQQRQQVITFLKPANKNAPIVTPPPLANVSGNLGNNNDLTAFTCSLTSVLQTDTFISHQSDKEVIELDQEGTTQHSRQDAAVALTQLSRYSDNQ